MKTLSRRSDLAMRRLGFFFECCLVLENCYDNDIPLVLRLKKLGSMLAETSRLLSVEKELLVWVASARWLSRIRSYQLAALTLGQYRDLSAALSNSVHHDVLGIAESLLLSEWFQKCEWRTVLSPSALDDAS